MFAFPLRLAYLILLCCAAANAPACETAVITNIDIDANNSHEQIMQACQRDVNEDEEVLYTWGHNEKFSMLQDESWEVFRHFNDQNQFAFASYKARHQFEPFRSDQTFLNFLQSLQSSFGQLSVAKLSEISQAKTTYGLSTLEIIEFYWRSQLSVEQLEQMTALQLSAEVRDKARLGVRALAYEQLYPGFLGRLGVDPQTRLNDIDTRLSDNNLSEEARAALEGEELGLSRALNPVTPGDGFNSNTTFGPGVYFYNNPYKGLKHFYGAEYQGLACTVDPDHPVYDLNPAKTQLGQIGFYLKRIINENQQEVGSGWSYPLNQNSLADPHQFRRESAHKLLKMTDIYIDGGSLNYAACRSIKLNDFQSCDAVMSLINNHDFVRYEGEFTLIDTLTFIALNPPAPENQTEPPAPQQQDLLASQNLWLEYSARLSHCAANYAAQNQRPETLSNLCKLLKANTSDDLPILKRTPDVFNSIRANYCP